MSVTTQQEEAVFDAAREMKDPVLRKAFLDRACGGDFVLRERVEQLLAAQTGAEQFFAETGPALRPATSLSGLAAGHTAGGTPLVKLPAEEQVGTCIGRYKLLQQIGEGGCGVVYMAEQEQPVRRRVALKIIKLGMDTKNVIARFEAERQALAMMDHPNIARVLDAGATDTGRPFFVMELVRGIRITEYCDKNQLDTGCRLDLFIQICQAIQHAHQKGIIHRDIKPSNILVTLHDGVPVPKVIDFGIAKATEARLTDKTLFTAYEQFIGTPAYMSPEQAEMSGLDIDTRSDIYSLGVLLYELLTGKTPFDARELVQSGMDAMRRTLREQEPQRPSTMVTTLQGTELTTTAHHRHAEPPKLISLLRGDLDWIVMKALEKDRTRRYETANGLAMDVKRYQGSEPILARPPSRLYRFQKLVRRNKGVFAAVGAVALALVAGMSVSTWLFLMEREAARRAVAAEEQEAHLRIEAQRGRANEALLRQQAEAREKIRQAAAYVSVDQFEEADAELANLTVTQPTQEGAEIFRALGDWQASHERWKPAAARFEVLLQVNQLSSRDLNSLDVLRFGPALLEAGRTFDYERFRRATIAQFMTATNPVLAERALKISLLLPADRELMKQLEPVANVVKDSFVTMDESRLTGLDASLAVWRMISLGLMDYRRGAYADAAGWQLRCLKYPEDIKPRTATAHVILAMAYYQLHRDDDARSELELGRALIEAEFKSGLKIGDGTSGFWFDWAFARLLLQEAMVLMDRRPSRHHP